MLERPSGVPALANTSSVSLCEAPTSRGMPGPPASLRTTHASRRVRWWSLRPILITCCLLWKRTEVVPRMSAVIRCSHSTRPSPSESCSSWSCIRSATGRASSANPDVASQVT
eukprot:scaffold116358_cov72-Phaeocystis_antarctica.AAC.1